MTPHIPHLVRAAVAIHRYGLEHTQTQVALIVDTGRAVLAEGGVKALATLLAACEDYATNFMHHYQGEWTFIELVWRKNITAWSRHYMRGTPYGDTV